MRIAVISDIHGNLEAFREVLKDMEQQDVHKVICLGDNIGYGPQPNEVVRIIDERGIPCTLGNHELGIVQPEHLDWFNSSARESLLITRDMLTRQTIDTIRLFPTFFVEAGGLFVHGCPPDQITTYLFELTDADLEDLFHQIDQAVSFVGHTHDLTAIAFEGRKVLHLPLGCGVMNLRADFQYIINIGSVGQPRDGNNNAKYVIWDTVAHTIDTRFVPYDIAKTARRILKLGLPQMNASRLW